MNHATLSLSVRTVHTPLLAAATALVLLIAGPARPSAQSYQINVLANFNGTNSAFPEAGLITSGNGTFYGTTEGSGTGGDFGSIFKWSASGGLQTLATFPLYSNGQAVLEPYGPLVPDGHGGFYCFACKFWATEVVYLCDYSPSGGIQLLAVWDSAVPSDLISNGKGGVYGTTMYNSLYIPIAGNAQGSIFEYSPSSGFQTLATFNGTDGEYPQGIAADGNGDLFGTTQCGGIGYTGTPGTGGGTIFELVPASSVPEPPAGVFVIAMGGALTLARTHRLRRRLEHGRRLSGRGDQL